MLEFTELFPRGEDQPTLTTKVWVTEKAAKEIRKLKDRKQETRAKLEECAEKGIQNFPNPPVHPERGNVYAIGKRSSLCRIAGFFDGVGFSEFMVCGAYTKDGQSNNTEADKVIDRCIEIRESKQYVKIPYKKEE